MPRLLHRTFEDAVECVIYYHQGATERGPRLSGDVAVKLEQTTTDYLSSGRFDVPHRPSRRDDQREGWRDKEVAKGPLLKAGNHE